jgi:hypothetical protein
MWTSLETRGSDNEWNIGGNINAKAELLIAPTREIKLSSCGMIDARNAKKEKNEIKLWDIQSVLIKVIQLWYVISCII